MRSKFEDSKNSKLKSAERSKSLRWRRYKPTWESLITPLWPANKFLRASARLQGNKAIRSETVLTYICILMWFKESWPSGRRSRIAEKVLDYGHYSIKSLLCFSKRYLDGGLAFPFSSWKLANESSGDERIHFAETFINHVHLLSSIYLCEGSTFFLCIAKN